MHAQKTQSQELEDEVLDSEYRLDQIADAQPHIEPLTLLERLALWLIGAFLALVIWIFGRGAYLATRELIRWL